jgi:alpha-galactosidase
VVAPDRSRALYSLAAVERSDLAPLGRLRFPGLDPDRRYRLRPLSPGKQPHGLQWPAWAVEGADVSDGFPGPVPRRAALTSVDLPGGVLVHSGVTAPAMSPETVVLFSLEEMSDR